MTTKQKDSEMTVKCWKLEVSLKNTPKWAFILVAVGAMFLMILAGLSLYNRGKYDAKVADIKERLVEGVPLSTADVKLLEAMPSPERESLIKNVKLKIKSVNGNKMEQSLPPGTKVEMKMTEGGEVEVRKGGVPKDDE